MKKGKQILIILSLFGILIIGVFIGVIYTRSLTAKTIIKNSEEARTCPATCDDSNTCTEDICSTETNFICINKAISPCCGNGVCKNKENYTACSPDCEAPPLPIPLEINKSAHNYTFQDVNQYTEKSSSLKEIIGPVRVKLVKIGKEIKGEEMRIRVYWEILNLGEKDIFVDPYTDTYVLVLERIFEGKDWRSYWKGYRPVSILLTTEREEDDFRINNDTYFGNIKTGQMVYGGVNIDNIPINVTRNLEIKVQLSISKLSDFVFKIPIKNETEICSALAC